MSLSKQPRRIKRFNSHKLDYIKKASWPIYKRDKALVGKVPEDFNFMTISSKQLDFVNSAKYFLKPNKFSHQNEFRFIWEVKEFRIPNNN